MFGFELRAAGEAPEAARRAGIDLSRIALLAMTFSGAIAGLGGATLVTGVLHRFNTGLSPGYGFVAIAVALVGNLEPFWICGGGVRVRHLAERRALDAGGGERAARRRSTWSRAS